ncbi:putative membrane protein [Bacteriovorax sp. BAL6_X]|uniref:hypothetical protein n=1 Tax=Bacteriovorax sp. BAL6_X TaxID=1201290 RepID=UPI0003859551|nr:hypothetical protein [Bacteriovorax sp. BAL6_X]EPZ52232.1 putative membrane protein [Bacteriovorax sp. BAL6_X]
MSNTFEMAKYFFLALGFGVFTFAPVANSKMTGGGFQKLLSTTCLVSLFMAAIAHIVTGNSATDLEAILLYISTICILFHHQLHNHYDEKNTALWVLYAIPTLIGLYALYLFQDKNLMNYLYIGSSVYYLGAITYAMILGHWYLVTPKLSEVPLKKAILVTWGLLAVKLIWSGFEHTKLGPYLAAGTELGGGYAFNWLMVIMRDIWGYLVIFGMSVFGWKLVSMRSIQSATGIFYAMTIFVFIGEMIAIYLFYTYGLLL